MSSVWRVISPKRSKRGGVKTPFNDQFSISLHDTSFVKVWRPSADGAKPQKYALKLKYMRISF